MHMLLILLTLCLRKPYGISRLFSIAYAFTGNGCYPLQHVTWYAAALDSAQPLLLWWAASPRSHILSAGGSHDCCTASVSTAAGYLGCPYGGRHVDCHGQRSGIPYCCWY